MFDLFKAPPYSDPELGVLQRSGGYWRGKCALRDLGEFELLLAGSRKEPEPQALEAAGQLVALVAQTKPAIAEALFEHYTPYREAIDAGEIADSTAPEIRSAAEVWPHVSPEHILIERVRGVMTAEVAFRTAWDEEHAVAAMFQAGRFVGLNGSVRGRR